MRNAVTSRLRDSWTITPLSFADCWICTRRAKMKNGFSGLKSCNKNRMIFSGTRRKVDISLRRLATPAFSFGWKKVNLLQVSFSLSLSLFWLVADFIPNLTTWFIKQQSRLMDFRARWSRAIGQFDSRGQSGTAGYCGWSERLPR